MMNERGPHSYADNDARWRAILNRDETADGAFYFAVRSTGIYCRPTCPSRRPLRKNITFFRDPEAAEKAGFRPCLRCRPKEVSTQQQVVAHILQLLDTVEESPSLAEISAAVGLSPSHLQRLFRRVTGLSPKQYAATQRLQRFKAGLKHGHSVTGAMYEAGYGSSRALYETAHEELGMQPTAYMRGGRGEQIAYALTDSPLGRMLIAATKKGICALRFGNDDALTQELRLEFPHAILTQDQRAIESHIRTVLDYLSGRHAHLDLSLDVHATEFQQRVWAALREIPYGQTRSYREIAHKIGEPNAVRAVARACARNPVALVVPCHRVVRANGKLSGYRWGVQRKRALLARERTPARP